MSVVEVGGGKKTFLMTVLGFNGRGKKIAVQVQTKGLKIGGIKDSRGDFQLRSVSRQNENGEWKTKDEWHLPKGWDRLEMLHGEFVGMKEVGSFKTQGETKEKPSSPLPLDPAERIKALKERVQNFKNQESRFKVTEDTGFFTNLIEKRNDVDFIDLDEALALVGSLPKDERQKKTELAQKIDRNYWYKKNVEYLDGYLQKLGNPLENKEPELDEKSLRHLESMLFAIERQDYGIGMGQVGKSGVNVQWNPDLAQYHQQLKLAEEQLIIERGATEKIRKGLTMNMLDRKGKVQEGVKNSCKMASRIVEVLSKKENEKLFDELISDGGLLSRIIGGVEGQGGHQKGTTGSEILKTVMGASERLESRKGVLDGDGNTVLQFINAFTDGLTEVCEGRQKPIEQFEKLWAQMGFDAAAKTRLLERVIGYKEIANVVADTGDGKGGRKDKTRGGFMPDDPRHQIFDPNALIKNDISGSMHSCLLAQELAETLFSGKEIKRMEDPVFLEDEEILNARMLDAFALTAGGKSDEKDIVFHTAYEMINGIRAMTGLPHIPQEHVTKIVESMTADTNPLKFTDAVRKLGYEYPPKK